MKLRLLPTHRFETLSGQRGGWQRRIPAMVVMAGALLMMGCRQDMHDQPRFRLNAATDLFGDRRAARPHVQGTVARGMLKADTALWLGKVGNRNVDQFPFPVTREVIERGRDRYNIYCTPCHGIAGYGDGMIVSRGLKKPPSYHTDALREQSVGHFYNVITNGNGSMMSYASRIPMRDRWAIVAYVRVLQQSQNVKVSELTAEEKSKVEAAQ